MSALPTQPASPGPPVTDTDTATVNVVQPDLNLSKSVNQHLVFPGTSVTYTYVATNTGTADLRNPADPAGAPTIPPVHWVVDDKCADVTYVSGDANNDGLLNPGEAWHFTCQTPITAHTVNVATITAVTVAPQPVTLVRHAADVVDVVVPSISITKTALRGVVLDPSATPGAGPDVPTPRQAEYHYQVVNPGSLPLADVASRVTDDKCSPLTFDSATDLNGNGLLDPGEVWDFTCATTLTKADGSPPNQVISSLVTNTARATGTPVLAGTPHPSQDVSASDQAQVQVIKPGLTMTKTASEDLVRPGDSVTYTYRVTNTGDVGLQPIDITDDTCAPVTFTAGRHQPQRPDRRGQLGPPRDVDRHLQPGRQRTGHQHRDRAGRRPTRQRIRSQRHRRGGRAPLRHRAGQDRQRGPGARRHASDVHLRGHQHRTEPGPRQRRARQRHAERRFRPGQPRLHEPHLHRRRQRQPGLPGPQ